MIRHHEYFFHFNTEFPIHSDPGRQQSAASDPGDGACSTNGGGPEMGGNTGVQGTCSSDGGPETGEDINVKDRMVMLLLHHLVPLSPVKISGVSHLFVFC